MVFISIQKIEATVINAPFPFQQAKINGRLAMFAENNRY